MSLLGNSLNFESDKIFKKRIKEILKKPEGLSARVYSFIGTKRILLTSNINDINVRPFLWCDKLEGIYIQVIFSIQSIREMNGNSPKFRQDHLISEIEYYYNGKFICKHFFSKKQEIEEGYAFTYVLKRYENVF